MIAKDALEFLRDQALKAAEAQDLKTFIPAVLVGEKIVSTEFLQPGRSRFRGIFSTESIESFVEYAAGQGEDPQQVFVNAKEMSATAFFNLLVQGVLDIEPGHADHRAIVTLPKTVEFDAVLAADGGQRFTQKQFIEFVQDWSDRMVFFTDNGDTAGMQNSMSLSRALASIRSIKTAATAEITSTQMKHGIEQSAFEKIEATSKEQLPDYFTFEAVPHLGLYSRTIKVRITVNPEGEKPTITPRIVGLGQLLQDIADEFKSTIAVKMSDKATVLVGTFKP